MLAIILANMSISNTTYAGYDCLKSSTRSLVYTDVVEAPTTDGMITEVGYNSSTGQYVCGTGQVLYEFDKVYASSAPSYPLLIDYAVGGDKAPFSYLVTQVGTIDPTYGTIMETQPNSKWGWTYSSGKSLGSAADAFGFGLHAKMTLGTGCSISHQFTTKHSRYIGYDRNTGQKMGYWTHN